jgi:hypothetical protein
MQKATDYNGRFLFICPNAEFDGLYVYNRQNCLVKQGLNSADKKAKAVVCS